MSVSFALLIYVGRSTPWAIAGKGEPWPLTPRGGNLMLRTTAWASAGVLIWGMTRPLDEGRV